MKSPVILQITFIPHLMMLAAFIGIRPSIPKRFKQLPGSVILAALGKRRASIPDRTLLKFRRSTFLNNIKFFDRWDLRLLNWGALG